MSFVASLGRCAFAALCVAGCARAWAAQSEKLCNDLEASRYQAVVSGDAQRIEIEARRFLEACRTGRPKGLVAVALEEVAAGKRLSGRYSEALESANGCLQYHYEAVGCHAEKALALVGLRLHREAREVVETGRGVGARELARSRLEMDGGRSIRPRERTQDEADQRFRGGELRERLAKRGLERLSAVGSTLVGEAK